MNQIQAAEFKIKSLAKKLNLTAQFGRVNGGPPECKYEVQLGECPLSWFFYGSTQLDARRQALAWLRKPKTGCVCDW